MIQEMEVPLCVDLDGTLIRTNSLLESFLQLVKAKPLYFILAFVWLCKGRAYLKEKIAAFVALDVKDFPVTEPLLAYLKQEKKRGRDIYLVTASHLLIAEKIASGLPIFTDVIATQGLDNIKGTRKREVLNNKFGEGCYDYAGNSSDDLHVWSSARQAIVVNARQKILQKSYFVADVTKVFPNQPWTWHLFLRSLRVHQYIKNILVFIPLLAAHLYFDPSSVMSSVMAFFSFCLMASSVYVINDLLDLPADRRHKSKKNRPFASGDLPIAVGLVMAPLLLLSSLLLAIFLPISYLLCLLIYYVITTAYSFYIKQKLLLDVFFLAILYTLRIIAGSAALGIASSTWLLSFSLFFFLGLAFVKRFSELMLAKKNNEVFVSGRGYRVSDIQTLSFFGIVSSYISILVLALYINSRQVIVLYQYPDLLWIICLLLLYWVTRVWMLASRGVLHDDPIVFALTDKVSLLVLFAMVLLAMAAVW